MDKDLASYKALRFADESNRSSMLYEVKRTRAMWDPGLSIPGTGRRGGWRCPPGTRYGGQITDRFGRNCGWGVARRLANAVSDLGERLENIGDNRRDRRAQRAVNRLQAAKPDRGGVVERAAGRAARALERDNRQDRDSFADPNNLGAELPGDIPRDQRPIRKPRRLQGEQNARRIQRDERRGDRDSFADPNNLGAELPGDVPRDQRPQRQRPPQKRGVRNARVRREGNLRTSERRRMEREIERPGATRTPIDGDKPKQPVEKKPRPAPKARRRQASVQVAKDRTAKTPPKQETIPENDLKRITSPDSSFDKWIGDIGGFVDIGSDDRKRMKDLWDAEAFGDDQKENFRDEVNAGNWGDEDALDERINQNVQEAIAAAARIEQDLIKLRNNELDGQKRIDALDRMVVNAREIDRRAAENLIFGAARNKKPWNNPETDKPQTPPKPKTPSKRRGVARDGEEIPPTENRVEKHLNAFKKMVVDNDIQDRGINFDHIERVFDGFWGDNSAENIHGGRPPTWADRADKHFGQMAQAEELQQAIDAERRALEDADMAKLANIIDMPADEQAGAIERYINVIKNRRNANEERKKRYAEDLRLAIVDYEKEIINFRDNNDLIGNEDQRRAYMKALGIRDKNMQIKELTRLNDDDDARIAMFEKRLAEAKQKAQAPRSKGDIRKVHAERFNAVGDKIVKGRGAADWADLRDVFGDVHGNDPDKNLDGKKIPVNFVANELDNDWIAKWSEDDLMAAKEQIDHGVDVLLNDALAEGLNEIDAKRRVADAMLRAVNDFEKHKEGVKRDLDRAVIEYRRLLRDDASAGELAAQARKILVLNRNHVSAQHAITVRAEAHNRLNREIDKARGALSPRPKSKKPSVPDAPPTPSLIERSVGNRLRPYPRKVRKFEGGLRDGDDRDNFAKHVKKKGDIDTQDKAVEHIKNGGSLDDIPHDFWQQAVALNPTKFQRVAKKGGAIGDTKIYVALDENGNPTNRGWVFKAASPRDNMGEILGFNLANAHGFDIEGAVRDGAAQGGKRFMVIPFAYQNIPDGHVKVRGDGNNFDAQALNRLPDKAHPQRLAHAIHNFLMGGADRHEGNAMAAVFKDTKGKEYGVVVPIDQGWAGKVPTTDLVDYVQSYFWMDRNLLSEINSHGKRLGIEHIDAVMVEYDKIVDAAQKVIDRGFDSFKKQALAAYPGVRADAAVDLIDTVWAGYVKRHAGLVNGRQRIYDILAKK